MNLIYKLVSDFNTNSVIVYIEMFFKAVHRIGRGKITLTSSLVVATVAVAINKA